MADSNSINKKPWRVLALRAHFHMATARLLIDLALEAEALPEPAARHLRGAAAETLEAQSLVAQIVRPSS
jgi:hypothetical protein